MQLPQKFRAEIVRSKKMGKIPDGYDYVVYIRGDKQNNVVLDGWCPGSKDDAKAEILQFLEEQGLT